MAVLMTDHKRIVCFGELLLRLAATERGLLLQTPKLDVHVGGAEANVAVSLARFGHDAAFASVVADNALGRAAADELRRHGVDTGAIAWASGRMGLYFLTPGAGARAPLVLYDRAGSAFALALPEPLPWERVLSGAAWLHVSGIVPAVSPAAAAACERAVATAVRQGVAVSFDGNYRHGVWGERRSEAPALLRALLGHARIAFVDDRDIALVLGRTFEGDALARRRAAADAAFEAFPKLEAIYCTIRATEGVERQTLSAAQLVRGNERVSRTHRLEGIVDRVGSGDAFAAGVLHGRLTGLDEQKTLELAAAAAVLKHSIPGDFNLASLADVERLAGADPRDIER
jgi:2-dehydro-3-deoxygluconokinase